MRWVAIGALLAIAAVAARDVDTSKIPLINTTVTVGDGPDRPNDIITSDFWGTTIERGPVKTHDCTTYKPSPDGAMIFVECPKK